MVEFQQTEQFGYDLSVDEREREREREGGERADFMGLFCGDSAFLRSDNCQMTPAGTEASVSKPIRSYLGQNISLIMRM